MLEYEKKLHFDERYKNLQSLKLAQKIVKLIWGVLGYIVVYGVLKYILMFIPDFQPWGNIGTWFTLCTVPFSKVDCVYFAFGVAGYCYGSIRLVKITAENHSAQDRKSDIPTKLLIDGCYAKMRHPMYGTFIILQASLFLSLRSLIGIILAVVVVVFQYFNALWEEKKKLIPLFGDDYRDYSRAVRNMLLRKWEILVLAIALVFSAVGFIV